jgi:glutamate formiminotransferase
MCTKREKWDGWEIQNLVMNKQIVECVPNFSEGRRADVMEAIVEAIRTTPGIKLLDWSHDVNHNRMVVTFVGEPDAVVEGAFHGARKAVELIDLNQHTGEHPRIGAVDVIPFVPVSGITLEECAQLAYRCGKKIWEELKLPVYYYEAAAKTPTRKNLSDVRNIGYEKLKTEVEKPERHPDEGEPRLHPTAGAVVVGARPFLVAFNINLNTPDVKIAKAIANRIREARGGLKNVKALGMELKDRNMAQVSMNLVNCDETPIYRVIELVKAEARRDGVSVAETEIVGLVPLKYLLETTQYYMQLAEFRKEQILEANL